MKMCTICKQIKTLESFPKKKNTQGKYYSRCRECRSKYNSLYAHKPINKEKHKLAFQKYRKSLKGQASEKKIAARRREKIRTAINDLKNAPCLDCGMQYPPYVMDFDHRPKEQKMFTIGSFKNSSFEKLLEEIKKCDVICSNCHRMRTHHRYNP